MRNRMAKVTAFCLSAGLVLGNGAMAAYAEENAPAESEAQSESEADVVGTTGFAECEDDAWVNVRAEASTETGEVIGVLKNHDSAQIEEADENGWYKIKSGDVEGYVAGWLIKTGEEADAIAAEVAYHYAISYAAELNVRSDASSDAGVITSLGEGDEAEVVDETGDWYKVCLDADTYGYVSKDYVEYKTAYPTGETIDQLLSEAAEESGEPEETAAADEAAKTDAAQPETYTEETSAPETEAPQPETNAPETSAPETEAPQPETYEPETSAPETEAPQPETYAPETSAPETEAPQPETYEPETSAPETEAPQTETTAPETEAPSSGLGLSVVSYASQFVGCPYEWGGTDPNTGADCSGFTQYVFAHFGVSLPHYSGSQMYCGTSVSLDSLQPGDLVFYSYSSYCDHVAIYAGNGAIISAAGKDSGICWGSLGSPIAAVRVV